MTCEKTPQTAEIGLQHLCTLWFRQFVVIAFLLSLIWPYYSETQLLWYLIKYKFLKDESEGKIFSTNNN
mgnify:CR=1 FL=1